MSYGGCYENWFLATFQDLAHGLHEVLTKMAARLLEVRLRLPVAFFFLFTWNIELLQTFAFKFVCFKYTFLGQIFLVETLSSRNCLFYVWNPSKSFLVLKKVNLRILSTFKRSFSKKMGKTPSSHITHSLGGEYCRIVRDSKPIRLLKSPRSLSVYKLY